MSRDPRVDELLAPLRDGGPGDGDRVQIDRHRVLARMSSVAANAPLERARRFRRLVVLAVAAGFAVTLGALAARREVNSLAAGSLDVTVVSGDVSVQDPTKRAIGFGHPTRLSAEGDLTTASHAEARIHTANGIDLEVFENTRLALADLRPPSSALRLGAGSIRCRVPRLAPVQTFSVVTPDANIVVRGTVFSVEVGTQDLATYTTVRVEEGVVVVHHRAGEVELTPSQSWTSAAAKALAAPSPAVIDDGAKGAGETVPRAPGASRAPPRRAPESAPPGLGTLDEETRLLRSGLAAERGGDLAAAVTAFELLLSRYPQSPLVPEARAALIRVKNRHGGQVP